MSHTTTGEWKSFEVRMRRRRAERLVARAEAAADAGQIEEARACLAEASRVAPSFPGIAAVEQKLAAVPVRAHAVSARRFWVAAASVLAVLAVSGWLVVRSHPLAPPHDLSLRLVAASAPPSSAATTPPSASAAPASAAVPPASEAAFVRPSAVAAVAAPADAALGRTSPDRSPMAALRFENRDPTPAPPPLAVAAAPPSVPGPSVEAVAVPAARTVDPAPPIPLTPIPVDGDVAAVAAAIDALPTPPPVVTTPTPRADTVVRGVLDRYAAAYSALDADAAGRVWPRVNRAALTRAFESLASQRISLGECRIEISGASARASCAGTATWVPKIGGGEERTEGRRWTFELARSGSDWQIVNARVQNR